jgi:hypothetical protein
MQYKVMVSLKNKVWLVCRGLLSKPKVYTGGKIVEIPQGVIRMDPEKSKF